MPVRFLIHIAITALTRLLISDVSHHNSPDIGIIYLCGGILLLAFAILVVRYASYKYPSAKISDSSSAVKDAVDAGDIPKDDARRWLYRKDCRATPGGQCCQTPAFTVA